MFVCDCLCDVAWYVIVCFVVLCVGVPICLMCVNVLFVICCVILAASLVVLVCLFNVLRWFAFDSLCDVLWLAFVLCSCG